MANLQQQDAIALLKEDHRKVEDLFKQFEKASGHGRKQKLAQQICLELTVHSIIEEEIFYPAIRGKVEEDLLNESLVEHDSAKLLISEIEAADGADDEFFDSKVKVLREQIEHHIEEEEKGKDSLFGQTREADVDLKRLGEQLSERKKALTKEFKEKGLPAPELSTMTEVEV
jgi:hemerythrin superfamily protein